MIGKGCMAGLPVGNDIIRANGPDRALFWGRLPRILISALLEVVLYFWERLLKRPAHLTTPKSLDLAYNTPGKGRPSGSRKLYTLCWSPCLW